MSTTNLWQAMIVGVLLTGRVDAAGTWGGEFGATVIESDVFWAVRLQPELAVGRLGFGLDAELLMQDRGGVREDDWSSSHKWVRLIRYLQWGLPEDPFVARIGALDDLTVGHGLIVQHYTNWYDEDFRRLGMHMRGHAGRLGGDSFSSSLGRWEILGTRIWGEPLACLGSSALRPWRIAATVVTDRDPDERRATHDGLVFLALDTELPVVTGPPVRVFLYGDIARILDFGRGGACGIGGDLGRVAGISALTLRLERRILGTRFLPCYIDAFYGVDRYDPSSGVGKRDLLSQAPDAAAIYAELGGFVLDTMRIVIGFSRTDGQTGSGVLHLEVRPRIVRDRWQLSGRLDKGGIERAGDLTNPNGRTLLEATASYRLNPHSLLRLTWRKSYVRGDSGAYVPVDLVIPRLALSVRF